MHPVLMALAAPAAMGLVFLIALPIMSRIIDGPGKPIVVVDRRTYRLAERRVAQAEQDGNLVRAHAGATAIRLWLRREVHSGPKRRRLQRSRQLEWWELQADRLMRTMHAEPEPGR
jgi:hypothetical protein